MIAKISRFAILFLILLVLGCRSAPVYNVESAAVVANKPASMQDVEKAIMRAGLGLSWQMTVKAPGKIEGVLVLRTHRAVVDITYDEKSYSIKYKDSANLDYDGTVIHKNYNGWVQNLDKGIKTQLSTL